MNAMRLQFTLAARYLLGRKLRAALTTLAVVFGVMVLVGTGLLVPTLYGALRQNLVASAGKVDLSVTHATGGSFSPAALELVRTTEGIAQATGMLRRNVLLPASLAQPVDPRQAVAAVTVVGLDPATAQRVRSYPLAAGRFLVEGDAQAIVISSGLASKLSRNVGDTFTLPSAEGTAGFRVVGVLTAPPVPGVEEVYVPLAAAQKLLNQPGQLNTIEALFRPSADRAQVEAAVQARLGDGYRLGTLETGGELLAAMKMGELVFSGFGLLALAMAGFIIFNTFRTAVAERRRDLGMLRAVGASRPTILGITLAESLVQGLVGTAIGMLAGYALAAFVVVLLGSFMRDFLRVDVGWPVPTPATVVGPIVLGVGFTVAAGLWPAFAAARVTPLEALRPASGSPGGRAAGRRAIAGGVLIALAGAGLASGVFGLAALGTLLFVVGLILIAPAAIRPIAASCGRLLGLLLAREGQIAQGNLASQPGRAAITASAMMIGLALVIAMLGVTSSVFGGFLGYLDRSLGAHFLIMPSSLVLGSGNLGAGPELARRVRETPGIGAVTTLRQGTSEVRGIPLQVIGIDPATFPTVSGLEFSQGEPAQAYAALGSERAIIVNGVFAVQSGAKIGDVLTLRTPEGDQPYRVVGIGLDYLNAKLATGYLSQANLARDFHQTADVLLMANVAPGTNAAAVRGALERVVEGYPAFALLDSAAFRESQEQALNKLMTFYYVLMLAIALPGLIAMINTLAINVIERTREIGVLRAVGSTRRQVQRMILGESLLLAATGTAFGILAGLWLGYVIVGGLRVAAFSVSYDFPWAGVSAAVAVGLLFGVLAATIPARQAARLDIVTALRYE